MPMKRSIVRRLGLSCFALLLSLVSSAGQSNNPPSGVAPPEAQLGSKITVRYIDVDQGAAALVELPLRRGPHRRRRLRHERRRSSDSLICKHFFARRSDLENRNAALYITHSHLDHNTSLPRIVETFQVGRYIETGRANGRVTTWINGRLARAPLIKHVAVTEASVEKAGSRGLSNAQVDPLACAGVNPRIRILSGAQVPEPGLAKTDLETENNHSMTIPIDYGASSFLWTGRYGEART
jgi:competence protein ComEC